MVSFHATCLCHGWHTGAGSDRSVVPDDESGIEITAGSSDLVQRLVEDLWRWLLSFVLPLLKFRCSPGNPIVILEHYVISRNNSICAACLNFELVSVFANTLAIRQPNGVECRTPKSHHFSWQLCLSLSIVPCTHHVTNLEFMSL